ncbi:LEAF RUST 10 DISEASE-RESISTANCE LOCUS RECEPTOR-LIKE PROTEIN KINASE-like [Canna indica]|uniref:LEAF RUST 10 DISEASE-RESISTANCE LOCUS RECEPTOR-LIKE PROTEIN KINASE-like n=1 Tax=Canna indica TaxID=4628 RepID=A0AAQ3Q992_9LILI|nr:LEAF RUST 10 DISEASE-RESISTANCE LOCUS RECEPTOR-LIKE PROTEIN KINASE-like [Canna indica]
MDPNIFILFFLLLSSVERREAAAPTLCIQDTNPDRCGNISIQYPFWLSGQQQPNCGLPPFELTCRNDSHNPVPVLKLLDFYFYINQIFYDNQSFQLTTSKSADEECPIPYNNITSYTFPFTLSSSNKRVFFLQNCSSSKNLSRLYQNITCPSFRWTAYFGGEYKGPGQLNSDTRSCRLVVVPVLEYSKGNYSERLKAGWLFNWTAPNCTECLKSGGRCGYDESTASFMCICKDRNHKSSCKNTKIARKFIIAGVTASAAFPALVFALGFLYYKHKKRQKLSASSESFDSEDGTKMDGHFQTHIFSYNELMEATECFNSSRVLGDGGFGIVYKGELRDGRTVAVKRLYNKNCKGVEQFINEVEILSLLRHQNLLSLYGCTSRRSHELILVYEFVPNGTVADHLHGDRAGERILTWPMRLSIAIETADALAYLHAVDPPIIHRDVKTNNILLDHSFHVKVGDFGLSRLFPLDATHVSTTPQGTPGYVDPEYHQNFQLTEKSDVYSFGVVLVELISSKPAIDISRQRSDIKLASMAIAKIQNHELDDLVDQDLWSKSDEMGKRMITMVAELAFRCLQSDGDMRPTIKEVLEVLRAIEKGKSDIWTKDDDDDGLMKNKIDFSPDSVAGKWVSESTTPNTSE